MYYSSKKIFERDEINFSLKSTSLPSLEILCFPFIEFSPQKEKHQLEVFKDYFIIQHASVLHA